LLVQARYSTPARPDRDEEEHIQAPQPDGIDGEEVTRERRCSVLSQERAPVELVTLRRRRETGPLEDVTHERGRDGDPELAQLADDADVAPVAVFARELQDELAHGLLERRPARRSTRVGPATGDKPSMPAQQRLRRDQHRMPRATRQHAAEGRQQETVRRRELRPPRLASQDRQLVAQDENLQLLGAVAAHEQNDQFEQPAGEDINERHDQREPPKDGMPTLSRPSPIMPSGMEASHRPSFCTPRA